MEIVPLGDSTLLLRLQSDFEKEPSRTLETVIKATQLLKAAHIPGVIELVPAYATIALFYDPVRVANQDVQLENAVSWVTTRIEMALRGLTKRTRPKLDSRIVEIPVCYDCDFGLDLAQVAQRANVSANEVISLHSAPEYRVHCVGFTPGFGFLSGLDPRLATPRRATPRTEVPAGSVAIGGRQTGVYPLRSPGGWNIIGRTPLLLFDVKREPPVLLQTGDRVRFRPITRDQFEELKR
jgi:inhibitor of KinA